MLAAFHKIINGGAIVSGNVGSIKVYARGPDGEIIFFPLDFEW